MWISNRIGIAQNSVQAGAVHGDVNFFAPPPGGDWPLELNAFLHHVANQVPDWVWRALRDIGCTDAAHVGELLDFYRQRVRPVWPQFWRMAVHAAGLHESVAVVQRIGEHIACSHHDHDFARFLSAALARSTPEAARIARAYRGAALERFVRDRRPEELTAYPNLLGDDLILNEVIRSKPADEIAQIVRGLKAQRGPGRNTVPRLVRRSVELAGFAGINLHDLRGAFHALGLNAEAKEVTRAISARARLRR
ncbi:hypothetical protein JOF53_000086 [Crossiella equi]|uniref:Uncharacterized protein n=1 Tax=Crossiella equi TaxID=130796 RepID=A0ABS5A3Q6_9PSEU|nr:hypothetical protein [Crossiella equi]MBP2471214.1 hypothetical protein [Crossiella equi]